MGHMLPTSRTELLKFHTLWIIFFVFRCGVVAAFTSCASQRHHNAILFAFASHFFTPFSFQAWLATFLISVPNKRAVKELWFQPSLVGSINAKSEKVKWVH